ncbi:hypothetical protein SISNIDRAFT_199417 [Sistotremastrum niveocremeum HHB9708]|uniref:Uncharacterized protein n=1 Tax=Sistotremastrum niveocremeum HHB9708 TaxID=1314777 RepID=A0A164ZND6_9AGAM|nr:hypothetical protein SISNIDRAFT_199417 [Sistotremastrum niveocremeum HHB9708]
MENFGSMQRDDAHISGEENRLAFLKEVRSRNGEDVEAILREVLFQLIKLKKSKDALGELELFLPSSPFQENAVMHIYASVLSLANSQQSNGSFSGIAMSETGPGRQRTCGSRPRRG